MVFREQVIDINIMGVAGCAQPQDCDNFWTAAQQVG